VTTALRIALEGSGRFQPEEIEALGESVLEQMRLLYQVKKDEKATCRVEQQVTFAPSKQDVQVEEEDDEDRTNKGGEKDLEVTEAPPP
jgi:hypothetical protein